MPRSKLRGADSVHCNSPPIYYLILAAYATGPSTLLKLLLSTLCFTNHLVLSSFFCKRRLCAHRRFPRGKWSKRRGFDGRSAPRAESPVTRHDNDNVSRYYASTRKPGNFCAHNTAVRRQQLLSTQLQTTEKCFNELICQFKDSLLQVA